MSFSSLVEKWFKILKPWEFLDARGFTGSDAWLDQIQEHQPRNGTYVGAILHIFGMCIW